ncbi:MAG TPA: pitrilysin family protein [Longimicrobiales bacterium]|nr:pitrilysin family protein [Longimicrobiales bacterium]
MRPSASRRRSPAHCLALALLALATPRPVAAQTAEIPEIAFTKFELDNGLTLIVHEDRKAPIVAVNVWYHVGSKNERPGKTGFAHLFEHLMFNGSENYNDDYFKVLEPLGATDLNGTTSNDRTNYFQNVPTSALDVALWMESDRMGHLTGAIDQAKLDEQRGVVQNEKRQGENNPYGQVFNRIFENTYPAGHPYSWSVIGSMDDLDAASLEDVHGWFETYYGAANAVIVLAGDIDPETARDKVERYFGDIPSGPPVTTQDVWIAPRSGEHRMSMQDRVPQARVYKVWNVPEWGSQEAIELGLFAQVLASGKNSRLFRRLVYEDQVASDVSATVFERELGSLFLTIATALPGQDLSAVEAAMDEEMERLLREGPTTDELALAQTQVRAGFVRGVERIGGFGGKSDVLASNEVYAGDPQFYRTRLERVAAARPEAVLRTANDWLDGGAFVLEVHPYREGQLVASTVDRSRVPEPGEPPVADFPEIERSTLANGLEIVLARRDAVPVVNLQLHVDAGYAADAFGTPGTANLAMSMLDEGTESRDALQIDEDLRRLGATLFSGSNVDVSTVSMSSLSENLAPSLALLADVVMHPAFPEADFQRLRQQVLAGIQQESVNPVAMALRVMPKLMYGDGHPYSLPLTGSGTTESVGALTVADLRRFHETWFKPNNAKLLVVGNTTMAEMRRLVEDAFDDWERGSVPDKALPEVAHQDGQAVYIMDRPDALQSVIFAGHVAPPRSDPDDLAISTMNGVLGGEFSARINMNLREDKGWSYGAQSLVFDARGQRPFLVLAPVQSDRTTESVQELISELQGIVGERPVTEEELDRTIRSRTLTLPGSWETNGAVLGSIAEIERFDLPEDYFDTLAGRIRGMTTEQLDAAARRVVQPDRVIWVVVGDKESIEEGLRGLGLGPVYEIDPDGNIIGRLVS